MTAVFSRVVPASATTTGGSLTGVMLQADGRRVGGSGGVADGVGEAVGAVGIEVRRIGQGAVAVDRHGAAGPLGDRRHQQALPSTSRSFARTGITTAVSSRVEAASLIASGASLTRRDGDRNRAGGRAALAVGDVVGERIGSVGIGRRGVGCRARRKGDGTLGALGHAGDGQRVVLGVGVIGEDADRDRRVLGSGSGVGDPRPEHHSRR